MVFTLSNVKMKKRILTKCVLEEKEYEESIKGRRRSNEEIK